MRPSVLVAGVGNIFLGDDGFGCEVARRLAGSAGDDVRVVDYGIRGMHLAYDLLDGYATLIHVLAVDEDDLARMHPGELDAHGMDPAALLGNLRGLGGRLPRTFVVGCEPETVAEGIGLSEPVAAAVDAASVQVIALAGREVRTDRALHAGGDR